MGPLPDQHVARAVLGQFQRAIDQRLVLDDPLELQPTGSRQQQHRARIVDTQCQLIGCKSAEYHRVNSSDARASQHGHGGLGHHRHVDDDAIAFLYPKLAQQAGQSRDFFAKLKVGERLLGAGHRGIVNQRQLISPTLLDLVIQRQVTTVQSCVREPPVSAIGIVLENHGGCAVPRHRARLLCPEGGGVGNGLGVTVLIAHGELTRCCCS